MIGFVTWRTTRGTFIRVRFHRAFVDSVVRILNSWHPPRSIAVIDNARIQMCKDFEDAVHACGAILLFLPPYSPQFNPIEVMFGQLNRWFARHANLAFSNFPELFLDMAMRECVKRDDTGAHLIRHCVYSADGIDDGVFSAAEAVRAWGLERRWLGMVGPNSERAQRDKICEIHESLPLACPLISSRGPRPPCRRQALTEGRRTRRYPPRASCTVVVQGLFSALSHLPRAADRWTRSAAQ